MYIIYNRQPNNNKKKLLIIIIIIIFVIIIFGLSLYLKNKSSNPKKNPYSDKTQIYMNMQKAFAERNDIQQDTIKTKKHPNGLYKELVYEDGSFFKISEQGKIQQAYWRIQDNIPPKNLYKLFCYDENENLIKFIEIYRKGFIIKDFSPDFPPPPLYEFKEWRGEETPAKPLKLTEMKLDNFQIPCRIVSMRDNKDKKINYIYNSNEFIYGSYQEDSIMKLIDPYMELQTINPDVNKDIMAKYNIDLKSKEITKEILDKVRFQVGDILTIYDYKNKKIQGDAKIEKLEPAGSYFILYLKKETGLSNILDYEENVNYQKIEIIKSEDPKDKIPVELQYTKKINSDNSYSYTFNDGTIETYDTNGQLQFVKYPNEKIIFSYISQGENGFKFSCQLIDDSDLQPIINSYSDKTQNYIYYLKQFAERNNIQQDTIKTTKHPNGLYKELVYEDGSFLKIDIEGQIQQVCWKIRNKENKLELFYYDENENQINK